jgi:hypothetical protein
MRFRLRSKVIAAVAAILAGVALALFATSGPAVAFFSGGLFLDVQVQSPATLVARGAAVDVPLKITCNATDSAFVSVTVTQHSGSGVAQGSGGTQVACTGSSQRIVVRVTASAFGKPFKQGTAVATADLSGCRPGVCGGETDTETITLQR